MPVKKDNTTPDPTRTVRIDAGIHKEIKVFAAQQEREIKDVLEDAARAYLKAFRQGGK